MEDKDKIILFTEKKDCCGCGACMNDCPKQAISMEEDEYGFIYPVIDEYRCVKCGNCKKVCAFQNTVERSSPIATYVASSNDAKQIMESASGGIFAGFATKIFEDGGVAFGATMEYKNKCLIPMHICINDRQDLIKLQGSKYVQSCIGFTYSEAKKYLIEGKIVLFSGTPCQIAGLKGFLKKDYDNLLSVDIICHGVPNAKFFQDYLKVLEKKLNGDIVDFKFRDKTKGWGYTGKTRYKVSSGETKEVLLPCETSSYYSMFLKSYINRESCYSCKYASSHRPGDITIGDYWGVQQEHPELFQKAGSIMSDEKGISCIIVNTKKGEKYMRYFKNFYNLYPSTFEKAAKKNGQLNTPNHISPLRTEIFNLYKIGGYEAIEKSFKKNLGIKIYYYKLKSMMPKGAKRTIKKFMRKN